MASYSTPAGVDGFSRYFANAFNENEIIMITTGFLALFSRRRPIIRTDANVVDIDIVRGNEKTASYIVRGTVGEYLSNKDAGTGKYTNFSRKFPLSEETWALTVEQTEDRMAGESPYSGASRRMRTRDLAIEAYYRMVERTIRLWERTAAQSALTGTQQTILGNSDPDYLLDYKRNSSLIKTYLSGEQWTTLGVNPIKDIDARIDTLTQIGKTSGEYFILMGSDVIAGFFANDAIVSAGDNRRIVTVQKNPDMMPPSAITDMIAGGMTYVAYMSTNKGRKVHILTYDAWYQDDAGTFTPYMPAKSFLLAPLNFRADRYFGPGDTLPLTSLDTVYMDETFGIKPSTRLPEMKIKASQGVIVPQAMYVDAYPGAARKNATLRLQSAPIFATTQTDALFTGNSVVA